MCIQNLGKHNPSYLKMGFPGLNQNCTLDSCFSSAFSRPCKVILALVAMMFSNNSLNFNSPIDHLELFAGECSISKGEWKDALGQTKGVQDSRVGSAQIF